MDTTIVSISKWFSTLVLLTLVFLTFHAQAEDAVKPPIPPKRPAVLRASKAYIDELRARIQQQDKAQPDNASAAQNALEEIYSPQTPEPENLNVTAEKAPIATPLPVVKVEVIKDDTKENLEDDLVMNIKNPTREEVLNALDADEREEIKTDKDKTDITNPVKTVTAKPEIEPAAGEEDQSPQSPKIEKSKLISFYLEPEQIKLDENLSTFLRDHALKLMQEDNDLEIEIRSHATAIKDEKHSDARISLARALEVRTFLMNHKIDPSRLKLKPSSDYDNTDRIDLTFVKRP